MSIRKRLFLSNAAMIVMPIIFIIVIVILLNLVTSGGFNQSQQGGWNSTEGNDIEIFNSLKKTASLEQGKLDDPEYLQSLTNQLEGGDSGIIIRKGSELSYTSNRIGDISYHDLPLFGENEFNTRPPFGHDKYTVKQYDFYFDNGTEGSIFLLSESSSFAQFAKTFFPLLFISLILLLILTNVLLSYFMSKSILNPVRQLSNAAANIRNGNLDFSVKPLSKDELGELVKSFDDMRLQLKESMELRDKYENNRKELIANISHDLKTPITSIMGYVEGIQDGVANTTEKRGRYLETIHAKAEYMDMLIKELSLYSKLDVKSLPFHFEEVNIKAFIKDYLEEMKPELLDNNVHLTFNENATSQTTVSLDRDKLIRVMNNIIYNSIKYIDKSECIIQISLKDLGNMVEVCINDNGPGVSEGDLANIFNRFYQTDPSRNKGGSGLGLAIASQIIKAHGGSISATSPQNGGLTICFTLNETEGDKHA
ncbi:HAMP domain-containing sensor histidine kinase [Virgibacillus litoralis]|uniref:histidine kinase n=1 Tax=Virgibacillus litoralis TaxID=578221 RepID=A0ABS4HDZ7_9BACI|nr:HAMP domain-containing sensor histidine kinase [Virgibacillus litoralis]MBP1949073.1 histidine kinase [Virgibacillus litoralis]